MRRKRVREQYATYDELLFRYFERENYVDVHRNVLAYSGLANGAAPSRCM